MKFKYLWLVEMEDAIEKEFWHVEDVFETRQMARKYKKEKKAQVPDSKVIVSKVEQRYIKTNVE